MALTLLLGVSVHLSWELSRLEDETRSLAEDLALLRSSVERLELRSRPSRDASADKEASQLDNTAQ